jgi:hypothetical protein
MLQVGATGIVEEEEEEVYEKLLGISITETNLGAALPFQNPLSPSLMHYLRLFCPSISNPAAKRSLGVNTACRCNDLPSYFTAHLLNRQILCTGFLPYKEGSHNRMKVRNRNYTGYDFQCFRISRVVF